MYTNNSRRTSHSMPWGYCRARSESRWKGIWRSAPPATANWSNCVETWRRWWWAAVPWVVAAALALAAVVFWRQGDRQGRRIAELQSESAQQQDQFQRAREIVETLTATDAMRVTLVAAKTPPQPQGKAIY